MGIKIEKNIFNQLIKSFVNEHNNTRTAHSSRIDQIADDELPVLPNEHMPLQLSTEMPNVADDEYLPTTVSALSDAAATIAKEVPSSQIEFFYNQLHSLLKSVMDREEEARLPMMEALLFEAIDKIINENKEVNDDEDSQDLSDDDEDRILTSMSAEDKVPTPADIAALIRDNGHTNKAAEHSSKDTMNLDISDVKASGETFASFGHKARRVELPARFAMNVTMDAIENDPAVRKMLSKYVGAGDDTDAKRMVATLDIKAELEKIMAARTEISPELAAEMHMNVTFDKLKKAASENDESISDAVNDVINNIKDGPDSVSIKLPDIDTDFTVTKEILIKYLNNALSKNPEDIYDEAEASAAEEESEYIPDPLQPYRNELRQISGQNADKTGIYNADRLAQSFGLKGANAMRQGLATNTALKHMIVKHANQYAKSDMYDENNDPYGDFITQMNNSFNDFAMSPGIPEWIKAARKSPPKELNDPNKFIDSLEDIYNTVESGKKSIYDIEEEGKHETQIDFLKFAFENATNKKMMVKFRNDLQNNATEAIKSKVEGMSQKDASKIGDMLMGNKARPVFTKLENPKGNKIYDNKNANFIASFGLDEKDYFELEIIALGSIAKYLSDNNNDIFNKIYDDTENKAKVKTSLANSTISLTAEYRQEHRQLERQLALLYIIDNSDFDPALDMEANINAAMAKNQGAGVVKIAKDSDFGINEGTVIKINEIIKMLKNKKIPKEKRSKALQIIARMG